jgi:hypothetical protein
MNTDNNATRNQNASNGKPHAMLGAGGLAAALWKTGDPRSGWRYRFNIFRMRHTSGRVSQQLAPGDVPDLVKLAQLLAFTFSEEEDLDAELRDDLACLFSCLNEVFPAGQHHRPRTLSPDSSAIDSLRKVLEYLWDDESRSFAESPSGNHIYRHLVVLDSWLNGNGSAAGLRLEQVDPTAVEDHFGVCPVCGQNDGFLNVRRAHWFVCNAHRLRWCAGENLFSCWRRETTAMWREAWEKIREYREVTPIASTDRDRTDHQ